MGFDAKDTIHRAEKKLERNFKAAGLYMVSQIRKSLNTSQPYRRTTGARGVRYRGLAPSAPGAFPHKLSGQLIKSISFTVQLKPLTLVVGSNLKGYPMFLQVGTKKMGARPWLTLAWSANASKVNAILTK